MALFIFVILIIINCLTLLLASGTMSDGQYLEIVPSTIAAGHYFGLYEVEDTLNITCIFNDKFNISSVALDWILPQRTLNRHNHRIHRPRLNAVNLVIKNLTESDSGEYKCTAAAAGSLRHGERSIGINVKAKKGDCPDLKFPCSLKKCIYKRYTCDGLKDCDQGEDESSNYCGPGDPCENKLRCPDGRCIPYSWCCDSERDENCTTRVKHDCCSHMEKFIRDIDSDLEFQYKHKFNGMGFLQTTVYTVIGCAMSFMFIVTIIVIASCRVHMRRSVLSRSPGGNNRNITVVRTSNVEGCRLNCVPLYDLDVYFNTPGCNGRDVMSVNPLLVTYNVNNGVQFVGRPINPPPYSEVMALPPGEGPPPPYVSCEDLCLGNGGGGENSDDSNWATQREPAESDALFGSADRTEISVISSNVNREPPRCLLHSLTRESGRAHGEGWADDSRPLTSPVPEFSYISKDISCREDGGECGRSRVDCTCLSLP